jgi:peptide/nickel transport system permease protein
VKGQGTNVENTDQLTTQGSAKTPPNTPPEQTDSYVARRSKQLLGRYSRNKARRLIAAEQFYNASQYKLMVLKFRKHQVATVSLYLLVIFYLVGLLADFIAPYDKSLRFQDSLFMAPTTIHFIDSQGKLTTPFIYDTISQISTDTFKYEPFVQDKTKEYHIKLFVETEPYKLAGLIPMNHRLYGVEGGKAIFLFGSDELGRDMFSRIIYASRVSLFVGFGGVIISFLLGILLGGISGYFGGFIDLAIQRLIELLMSIPQIPIWITLAASIPREWSSVQTYFAITLILSFVGWTNLARVVRGKILSLREEDYVMAARISSAGPMAIIFRHLLPGFTSYLVVNVTITIPYMILGETTLSFLGLGIIAPDVSWGSLMQNAQDVTVIANYPWLLIPCIFVVVAVILFNFVGDGLRDAADPYIR